MTSGNSSEPGFSATVKMPIGASTRQFFCRRLGLLGHGDGNGGFFLWGAGRICQRLQRKAERGGARGFRLEQENFGAARSDAIGAAGGRRLVLFLLDERKHFRVRWLETPLEGKGDVRLQSDAEALAPLHGDALCAFIIDGWRASRPSVRSFGRGREGACLRCSALGRRCRQARGRRARL